MDWSRSNILAVAIDDEVYFKKMSVKGSKAQCLGVSEFLSSSSSTTTTDNTNHKYITAVKWMNETSTSSTLAVATSHGQCLFYDVEKNVRFLETSTNTTTNTTATYQITSLAWNQTTITLGFGSGAIVNFDVRSSRQISDYTGMHRNSVCGLDWNTDKRFLASGDDNGDMSGSLVCIWDSLMPRSTPFKQIRAHKTAVKAVAWSPWKSNLLATGGGKDDGCIKLWNVYNCEPLSSIRTSSQISGLVWSKHKSELVSSHGYDDNKLVLWKYPEMSRVQEFEGHLSRILGISLAPCGEIVASLGADETIRVWKCFNRPTIKRSQSSRLFGSRVLNMELGIR